MQIQTLPRNAQAKRKTKGVQQKTLTNKPHAEKDIFKASIHFGSSGSFESRTKGGFKYAIENWPSAVAASAVMALGCLLHYFTLPAVALGGLVVSATNFLIGFIRTKKN